MRAILMSVSVLALAVLFVLPVLHAAGMAPAGTGRAGILVGTIVWFATAPFWIKR